MNGSAEISLVRAIRGPITLITLGTLFALNNFTPFTFDRTWPVLLIVFGLLSVLRRSIEPVPVRAPEIRPVPPYQYAPPPPPPPPATGSTPGSFRQSSYTGSTATPPPPPGAPPSPAKGGFGSSAPPRPSEPGQPDPARPTPTRPTEPGQPDPPPPAPGEAK